MKLEVTDLVQDPATGAVTYNLHVSKDGFHIAVLPIAVAIPTPANIRQAQKTALRANVLTRIHEIAERQGNDVENG